MHLLTMAAAAAFILSMPTAQAGERAVTGAAIGAGVGAVVAGPVGLVAGGVIGAVAGGPRLSRGRGHRVCWHDRGGRRHCRRR